MNWDTHMLSGAIAGYFVTNMWEGAVIGGIAGVIPDFDEPNSKFGKLILPVSYPLSKIVAHRTLTHSLPFAFFMGVLGTVLSQNISIGYAVFIGIVAHILGDMLTGRVQLLYPIKRMYGIRVNMKFFYIIDRVTICLLFSFIFVHLVFKMG